MRTITDEVSAKLLRSASRARAFDRSIERKNPAKVSLHSRPADAIAVC
jgi:hypothetical protein